MLPTSILTFEPQAGLAVALAGGTYRVVISGEQTGQAYAAIDMVVPPHGGPSPTPTPILRRLFTCWKAR